MLGSYLTNVPDHRQKQGRRYCLNHILLFSVFAILSHAISYRNIHKFIKVRYDVLDEYFNLNWKRIPAYTTVRNIIKGVSTSALEESFRQYSLALAAKDNSKTFIAFDGKVLRGSFDHFEDQKAIQILSGFAAGHKLILAHQEIEEKTNEIPTAQDLIKELGLEDCVFTFDAINCQEKTLQAAKETKNNVIVQVKGNQKNLMNDCIETAETSLPIEGYEEPFDKQRNRIESRKVEVFGNHKITDQEKWHLVKAIVKVDRKREAFDTQKKKWVNTDETSYYISTTHLQAQEFCEAIRNHWGIENRNHYVRDVSMGEDKSRIRKNPNIFAKLRSFALNIMRVNKVKNIADELYENCLSFENILLYKGVMEN